MFKPDARGRWRPPEPLHIFRGKPDIRRATVSGCERLSRPPKRGREGTKPARKHFVFLSKLELVMNKDLGKVL